MNDVILQWTQLHIKCSLIFCDFKADVQGGQCLISIVILGDKNFHNQHLNKHTELQPRAQMTDVILK